MSKELQAPLKARYRETPDAAVITLKADSTLGEGITCSVQTGKALGVDADAAWKLRSQCRQRYRSRTMSSAM